MIQYKKLFDINWLYKWGIKTVLAYFFAKTVFSLERWFYSKRKNKNVKRRLFLTSGNINLINALTVIEQLNEKNTEDILIIDSVLGSKEFIERNIEVAKKHPFKKIITLVSDNIFFILMLKNIYKVDEIYSYTNSTYAKLILPLYKNVKYIILDEGVGSLTEIPLPNHKLINGLITTKYLNKLDRLGWKNHPQKFLDIDIFKSIAKDLAKKYPFDININKEDKVIIFCSSYYQQYNMDKNNFYNFQNNLIQQLINIGYTIIYKQHPREYENVNLHKGIIKSNCLLPLELYNIDCIGILSVGSSVSIQPFYYWQIPGFNALKSEFLRGIDHCNIGKLITKEYSLDFKELLKIDPKKYSADELKIYFRKLFQDNLDKKVLLSQHIQLNKIYNEYYENYIGKK